MNIDKLKKQLSPYGTIEVIKAGFVFTLLIRGKGLSIWETVNEINLFVNECIVNKYPKIEVMKNNDEYFLLVLKP